MSQKTFIATLTNGDQKVECVSHYDMGCALWGAAMKAVVAWPKGEPAEETEFPEAPPKKKRATRKRAATSE